MQGNPEKPHGKKKTKANFSQTWMNIQYAPQPYTDVLTEQEAS